MKSPEIYLVACPTVPAHLNPSSKQRSTMAIQHPRMVKSCRCLRNRISGVRIGWGSRKPNRDSGSSFSLLMTGIFSGPGLMEATDNEHFFCTPGSLLIFRVGFFSFSGLFLVSFAFFWALTGVIPFSFCMITI